MHLCLNSNDKATKIPASYLLHVSTVQYVEPLQYVPESMTGVSNSFWLRGHRWHNMTSRGPDRLMGPKRTR